MEQRKMGDFPFLSNAYGAFTVTAPSKSVVKKRTSDNVFVANVSIIDTVLYSNRSGHSSNHPYLLGGFGPLWRNPSSYHRTGSRKEGIVPGKYKLGSAKSTYLTDAYLDISSLNTVFTNADQNPHFIPGTVDLYNPSNDEVQNSKVKAIENALSDLASSKASMGENLAQLNQTVDLFETIAEASIEVFKIAKALKHGNLRPLLHLNVRSLKKMLRQRKVEKRIANYWLAYWYGFKPLVSDAYGLWELMKEQSKPVLLVHGRGRANLTHEGRITILPLGQTSPQTVGNDVSSVSFQTHLTGKLNDAQIARIINRAGLLNLPSLAWELVPFSFIVDWGVPVGTFLSNLTASSGLTFVGGSSTVRAERELLISVDPQWLIGEQSAITHYWGFGIDRLKLSSFPSGGLYSKHFFTGASRFAVIGALISNLTMDLKR